MRVFAFKSLAVAYMQLELSKPLVDGFAFQRQDAEDVFVGTAQRLSSREGFQYFDAYRMAFLTPVRFPKR